MDERTDTLDIVLDPLCILRAEVNHIDKRVKLKVYQCPIEDGEPIGPLALAYERDFSSPHSKKLVRTLGELTLIEEKAQ